jgi:SRSO17 transposase
LAHAIQLWFKGITLDLGYEEAAPRMDGFVGRIGAVLRNKKRRECFAVYAMGLLSSAERKSVEPIATQAWPNRMTARAAHERMLHFVGDSAWDDKAVRKEAAKYALEAMTAQEPVQVWIIDDTGFLKKGDHSVGVQRQYTGSAGKITNCPIGVSLTLATQTMHLAVDFELYLPECWANDPPRRTQAKIPDQVEFKTKPRLALEMIRRAIANGLPLGVVLADAR